MTMSCSRRARPGPGVLQLEDAATSCVVQLTHSRTPAGTDDRAATEQALDASVAALGEAAETFRQDATITTGAGAMAARAAAVTVPAGPQRAEVRMVLRSSTADRVLVGLVHICPDGSLDEDAWTAFVEGTTLRGTRATGF
ncbi:hypothetical protein [Georgenia sp. AZ-5]|uniref:hypothetical protein n=1 Tax=Georgenia sp. AZ-5 TaxID=3367526 RepID=UPI0037552A84